MSSDSNNDALSSKNTEGAAAGNPPSAEHKPPERPIGMRASVSAPDPVPSGPAPSGPATPPSAGAPKVSVAAPAADAGASPTAGPLKPVAVNGRPSVAPANGRPGAPSPAQAGQGDRPSPAQAGQTARPAPAQTAQNAGPGPARPGGAGPSTRPTMPEEDNIGAPLSNEELDRLKQQNSLVPEPSDVDYDPPLVQCMVTLFNLHGEKITARPLVAGLPKSTGPLHPSAVIRAAQAAGMHAKTVYRPALAQISSLTLPCILLLQGDKSCILKSVEGKTAEVLFPETGMETRSVELKALESDYLGYAIFAKPKPKLDRRASNIKLLKGKRWFWGTLFHFLPIYRHVFGASILVNLLAVCGPLFFMNVYDRVVPNHATDTLWMLAIGILLAYVFDFLLRNLRSYFVDVAGRNADIVLASRLMQQLLAMRLDVKPDSTGSLANNLREFESLRDFFGSTTLMALVDLPFLVFFVVLVVIIGGPIGIIPIVAVPLVSAPGCSCSFPSSR